MNTQEILQQAATDFSAKPKKEACFNATEGAINGEPLTDYDLIMLYRYFLPPIPATPKTKEQWVCKAMGKKDARYYLNYLYADETRLIATDGHRLHFAPKPEGMAPGYYDTSLNTCSVDALFPDIDRVIPEQSRRKTVYLADCQVNTDFEPAIELMPGNWFNRKYLFDAIGNADHVDILNYTETETGRPILIECQHGKAVIMGMRV